VTHQSIRGAHSEIQNTFQNTVAIFESYSLMKHDWTTATAWGFFRPASSVGDSPHDRCRKADVRVGSPNAAADRPPIQKVRALCEFAEVSQPLFAESVGHSFSLEEGQRRSTCSPSR
jgi:hypothetical protein